MRLVNYRDEIGAEYVGVLDGDTIRALDDSLALAQLIYAPDSEATINRARIGATTPISAAGSCWSISATAIAPTSAPPRLR